MSDVFITIVFLLIYQTIGWSLGIPLLLWLNKNPNKRITFDGILPYIHFYPFLLLWEFVKLILRGLKRLLVIFEYLDGVFKFLGNAVDRYIKFLNKINGTREQ